MNLSLLLLALLLGGGQAIASEFPLDFAYRNDSLPTERRTVIFQGQRGKEPQRLDGLCGPSGDQCSCTFYRTETDSDPISGEITAFSLANNSISCSIPEGTEPSDIALGRLHSAKGNATVKMVVRTALTIDYVIGDLDRSKVRGIFRYGCARTFLEGEGVSETELSCPASQRLGLITANYSYYLYKSQSENNFGEKQGNKTFENPLCERQLAKLVCDRAPVRRWGLYGEQSGPFQVGVTMTTKPDAESGATFGYVALPDPAGNCPTGLVKVRAWRASPNSITQGSIDGNNPPSSFLNTNGNLANTIIEPEQPESFKVLRRANQMPCASASSILPLPGSCQNATFQRAQEVQAVPYEKLNPEVCAIPNELLNGLF